MAVLLPKLFGRLPQDWPEWAERLIAFFEQQVNLDTSTIVPVGFIMYRASTTSAALDGWLECNGAVVSQAVYPQLYSVLGTTFNTGGEGAGNFRIPTATATIGGVANCKGYIRHDYA